MLISIHRIWALNYIKKGESTPRKTNTRDTWSSTDCNCTMINYVQGAQESKVRPLILKEQKCWGSWNADKNSSMERRIEMHRTYQYSYRESFYLLSALLKGWFIADLFLCEVLLLWLEVSYQIAGSLCWERCRVQWEGKVESIFPATVGEAGTFRGWLRCSCSAEGLKHLCDQFPVTQWVMAQQLPSQCCFPCHFRCQLLI